MAAQKFWKCTYAKTKFTSDSVLAKIKKQNEKSAKYISKLPQERWVFYPVKSAKYGHITLNI